jgi:hypothetical protein
MTSPPRRTAGLSAAGCLAGGVARARKNGSAAKAGPAVQRERKASGAADRALAACEAGMLPVGPATGSRRSARRAES